MMNRILPLCGWGLVAVLGGVAWIGRPAEPASGPPGAGVPGFVNPDFELGEPGTRPQGWFVPKALADVGFTATLTTNLPNRGTQCVEVSWPKDGPRPGPLFANVMQSVDAGPWQGKRLKVTASIRVTGSEPEARAQMWLRVDRPGGMGGFDNMGDRPVSRSEWADYSITVEVADDARRVNLGLMTFGGATAWWDDVRWEVVGEFKTLREPPRAVSGRERTNLVAFGRLLGYVRHFHPSDQAATNDWLAFAAAAIPQIESAESPAALARELESVFQPIAPTVSVFEVGKEPPLPPALTTPPGNVPLRIRAWEHLGYAQDAAPGAAPMYSSQRLTLAATGSTPLPAYAQPTHVYRANLTAPITSRIPTALFTDDAGTLPRPEARSTPRGGVEGRYTVAHRGARLATVMMAWNILRHFYPYFDVVDTDWGRELEVALCSAAEDADEPAFYRTLNRLIAALQDGHGTLSGPGMPMEAPIPIKVELVEERIVVTAVGTGVTELHPGDVVERIDGEAAPEAFDALARGVSAATPQRRKQVAFRFGRGPLDRPAKLEVRGADGEFRTVTLARTDKLLVLAEPRPPKLHEIKPGVFYADVTRLTHEEFEASFAQLAKARGLVFDLRGYPAGSPQWLTHLSLERLQSAHWNIPKQHRPDRSEVEWETSRWDLQPQAPLLTTNRVFLTDGSAISYSESQMGIIEAYRLGEIVGEATAGTNGNIAPVDLPLGYRMVFTGMQVVKHDGSRHHGVGIRPTIPVSKTIEGIRAGRDEQLDRAVAALK